MYDTLTNSRLAAVAALLAEADEDFARILTSHGPPPLWGRDPGFVTLLRIILEQQVSLISADAMYRRLVKNINPLTATTVLTAGAPFLRSFGVTRQKASYFVNLAEAIEAGRLDLDTLENFDDDVVMEKLTSIKGIGPWTARIYLLMALRRPDVWPVGDVALATAYKNLKGLKTRPTQLELNQVAKSWRPHRATAARLLWHHYLSEKPNQETST